MHTNDQSWDDLGKAQGSSSQNDYNFRTLARNSRIEYKYYLVDSSYPGDVLEQTQTDLITHC